MTDDKHSLVLGLAIISAIGFIYAVGDFKGQQADIAVLTGLIGVLGTFTRRSDAKSAVGSAETVNVDATGDKA